MVGILSGFGFAFYSSRKCLVGFGLVFRANWFRACPTGVIATNWVDPAVATKRSLLRKGRGKKHLSYGVHRVIRDLFVLMKV